MRNLSPLPKDWQAVAGSKDARAIPVGDRTVGDALDEVAMFAVSGTGPMSTREILPQTPLAADLLTRPEGQRIKQMLSGAAGMFDGREGVNQLQSVTLSHSSDPFALAFAMATVHGANEAGYNPVDFAARDPFSKAEFAAALRMGEQYEPMVLAHAGKVLNIGPAISGMMMQLAQTPAAASPEAREQSHLVASTLVHEMEHNITMLTGKMAMKDSFLRKTIQEQEKTEPADVFGSLRDGQWLEEASVNTLSQWPGRIAAAAKAMGLPEPVAPTDPASAIYPAQTDAMRRLLPLAGVDPADPSQFEKASDLLQGAGLLQVPGRLAGAMARQHGLDPGTRDQLKDLIRSAGVNHQVEPEKIAARIDAIEQLVKQNSARTKAPAAND